MGYPFGSGPVKRSGSPPASGRPLTRNKTNLFPGGGARLGGASSPVPPVVPTHPYLPTPTTSTTSSKSSALDRFVRSTGPLAGTPQALASLGLTPSKFTPAVPKAPAVPHGPVASSSSSVSQQYDESEDNVELGLTAEQKEVLSFLLDNDFEDGGSVSRASKSSSDDTLSRKDLAFIKSFSFPWTQGCFDRLISRVRAAKSKNKVKVWNEGVIELGLDERYCIDPTGTRCSLVLTCSKGTDLTLCTSPSACFARAAKDTIEALDPVWTVTMLDLVEVNPGHTGFAGHALLGDSKQPMERDISALNACRMEVMSQSDTEHYGVGFAFGVWPWAAMTASGPEKLRIGKRKEVNNQLWYGVAHPHGLMEKKSGPAIIESTEAALVHLLKKKASATEVTQKFRTSLIHQLTSAGRPAPKYLPSTIPQGFDSVVDSIRAAHPAVVQKKREILSLAEKRERRLASYRRFNAKPERKAANAAREQLPATKQVRSDYRNDPARKQAILDKKYKPWFCNKCEEIQPNRYTSKPQHKCYGGVTPKADQWRELNDEEQELWDSIPAKWRMGGEDYSSRPWRCLICNRTRRNRRKLSRFATQRQKHPCYGGISASDQSAGVEGEDWREATYEELAAYDEADDE